MSSASKTGNRKAPMRAPARKPKKVQPPMQVREWAMFTPEYTKAMAKLTKAIYQQTFH